MSILDKIVTPAFITWNAHMFFAAFVVSTALWYAPLAPVIALALGLAAFKEFYIDKHFEEAQSFWKNLQDFAGYASGVALGLLTGELTAKHVAGVIVDLINTVVMPLCKHAAAAAAAAVVT